MVRHQCSHRHRSVYLRLRAHFRRLFPVFPDEEGQEADELLPDAGPAAAVPLSHWNPRLPAVGRVAE